MTPPVRFTTTLEAECCEVCGRPDCMINHCDEEDERQLPLFDDDEEHY